MHQLIGLTRLKRIVEAGPKYVWAKSMTQVKVVLGRIKAYLFGTEISDASFRRALLSNFVIKEDFQRSFKVQQSRFFFIQPQYKEEIVSSLHQTCPEAAHLIIQAADTICKHQFDLLGSGPVNLGWPIDWHCDFKTGFRWNPEQYYMDVRPAPYPGGYDLKVPWELSRCQHFMWLGQAYWLTGDEKYTQEFRAEVEDWIRQNPPEFGVNWACSMDIAIRGVNWLWGYAFCQDSPVLDDDFRITFCKSLLCHGRHIMENLERTLTFSGNHYLSNIVGLIYLGILLPEFKEAQAWRKFGLKELESEMFKQIYSDGGDFEASTNYHRLVTELFLSATLLARLNGHNFSQKFMERLEKMLDFIYHVTKPDGTFPIIGDQDNGRLHRSKVWSNPAMEWKDFRPLLAIGCVLFERFDWGKMAANQWEEAIWIFGKDTLFVYHKCSVDSRYDGQSTGFKDTGLYIMRADDIYVAVDLGSVGQNGYGGHAHNDTLSFELFALGQNWIQDPGTYVYTSDYKARNLFRSTAFHNTLTLPNYEQNGFDAFSLFRLRNDSVSNLLSWHVEPDSNTYLAGELHCIKRPEIIHRRSFFLDRMERALVVTDWCNGVGSVCRFAFHISPGLGLEIIERPYLGMSLTNSNGEVAQVFSVSPGETKMQVSDGWVSESYGIRDMSDVVYFERPADNNHRIVVLLPGQNNNIINRVENAMIHERVFLNKYELAKPDKG
jgi:hypothetical protein